MKTADEYIEEFNVQTLNKADVIKAMQAYAAAACKEQREICAKEYYEKHSAKSRAVKYTILNAPQPQLL